MAAWVTVRVADVIAAEAEAAEAGVAEVRVEAAMVQEVKEVSDNGKGLPAYYGR
jgi:hypothetical protein